MRMHRDPSLSVLGHKQVQYAGAAERYKSTCGWFCKAQSVRVAAGAMAPSWLRSRNSLARRENLACGNDLAALRVLVHGQAACVLIASIVAILRIDWKIGARRRCETAPLCYAPLRADPPATISKEDNA
jgi:hypothetical protein